VGLTVSRHLQRALQDLEALLVGLVVVRRGTTVRGDLDLYEGVLAVSLLARLQDGGVVFLFGVVV
jgi:hypothetical protein